MTRAVSDADFAETIRRELHAVGAAIPVGIRIGITGSRTAPNDKQEFALGILINTLARAIDTGPVEMHHGCCTGTDETAHFIGAAIAGMSIIGHPGYGQGKRSPRMTTGADLFTLVLPELPYGERNRAITTASGILLACPRFPEADARSARSGTWQTIRLMRRARKPVIIIPPHGIIIHDHAHAIRED
jgi:hypothetical protein